MTNAEAKELGDYLAAEALKLVDAQAKDKGPDVCYYMIINVIQTLVYEALSYKPEGVKLTNKQAFDLSFKNFKTMKANIGEAVSHGFKIAMERFSGQTTEYITTIHPVPEPTNKLIC